MSDLSGRRFYEWKEGEESTSMSVRVKTRSMHCRRGEVMLSGMANRELFWSDSKYSDRKSVYRTLPRPKPHLTLQHATIVLRCGEGSKLEESRGLWRRLKRLRQLHLQVFDIGFSQIVRVEGSTTHDCRGRFAGLGGLKDLLVLVDDELILQCLPQIEQRGLSMTTSLGTHVILVQKRGQRVKTARDLAKDGL